MKRTLLALSLLLNLAAAQTQPANSVSARTLPAGTSVLLRLVSPLHTTSAVTGAAVYLETAIPVVADNHVVIPEHTWVMGVIEATTRPGRVQGRARMRMRFTTLVLPDNRVFSISGTLRDLPGAPRNRTVDSKGTLEPVDQIDRDVKDLATGVLPGTILAVAGAGRGPALRAGFLGGGLALGKVLFTRGDAISLPIGTRVEMVLQQPLQMDQP
jgi:hypothetical protein